MRNLLEFEYSPWLILVCLLLGAVYSYIQYTKDTPWSARVNLWLSIVRGALIAFIAILILGPLVRAVINFYEDPVLVIAVDSSESMGLHLDSLKRNQLIEQLKEVEDVMGDQGWEVRTVDLSGDDTTLDSLKFQAARTNLTRMIRQQLEAYTGTNLGAILVVSDGIFNAGFSPDLITPFTPIYTVGIGDTIPQKDVSIIALEYNKTVYQDNRYPVLVKLRNDGIKAASGNLRIYNDGVLLQSQRLEFNLETRLIEHEFLLEAKEPGKHRLSITLDSIPGESTTLNNRVQRYVDVIDGKQRILLAAEAPTPDMKAFRTALRANSRFEIEQAIGKLPESLDFDLIVLFNSPTSKTDKVYKAIAAVEVPKLYYLGATTDLRPYLEEGLLSFSRQSNQYDQVRATISTDIKAFNLVNDYASWLSAVPPMTVPFGDVILPANSQVILKQKVGAVVTERPIIYLVNEEPKFGVVLGDGFWTWRIDEFRNFGETARFDELVAKITQFLAAKPDNRQFKLYPAKEDFEIGEEMVFVAETYNQLFEPTYGEPVTLNIYKDSLNWSYSFTPLSGSNKFSLDNLPEGLYTYSGTTFIDGKKHSVSGQFSVEKPNVEAADLTADYRTLRRLARESGGKFFSHSQTENIKKEMASLEATSVIHSQESEIFLFNLSWVLILLLLLATIEWLTRKMMGGY